MNISLKRKNYEINTLEIIGSRVLQGLLWERNNDVNYEILDQNVWV